ncbi:MAG: hypothetical protein JNM93_08340 [Bacteriovoracaceae bacterium]|nr:hypothetical protein [Bacteriovoracaceae bacterium]
MVKCWNVCCLLLVVFLASCGEVQKTNDNIDKTNKNINDTNELIVETNAFLGEILDKCLVVVFHPEVLDPAVDKNVEKKIQFTVGTNEYSHVFNTNSLQTFDDIVNEKQYYVVPSNVNLPARFIEMTSMSSSICQKLFLKMDKTIDDIKQDLLNMLVEQSDVIVDYSKEAILKADEQKNAALCFNYRKHVGVLTGELEVAGKLKFKKRRQLKEEIREYQSLISVKCPELRNENEIQVQAKETKARLDGELQKFKRTWLEYYEKWLVDESLEFTEEVKASIYLPELKLPEVIGLHKSEVKSYANQMKVLKYFKNKLVNTEPEEFRAFLVKRGKSLVIDPSKPFSFEELSSEELLILQQLFNRLLAQSNSEVESTRLRDFISEAVFRSYERQLIFRKIKPKN